MDYNWLMGAIEDDIRDSPVLTFDKVIMLLKRLDIPANPVYTKMIYKKLKKLESDGLQKEHFISIYKTFTRRNELLEIFRECAPGGILIPQLNLLRFLQVFQRERAFDVESVFDIIQKYEPIESVSIFASDMEKSLEGLKVCNSSRSNNKEKEMLKNKDKSSHTDFFNVSARSTAGKTQTPPLTTLPAKDMTNQALFEQMNLNTNRIEAAIAQMNSKLDKLTNRMNHLEEKVGSVEGKLKETAALVKRCKETSEQSFLMAKAVVKENKMVKRQLEVMENQVRSVNF
nr:PREDICTED: 1-phosphatidylinositol 4,5-bisphosphate phosphodiesterase zeta-1 [Latimeria chalumnae]|eukprot:XP_014347648.1 PREDICTED: 1-phosphatidylinositol 4,5-bisphosphate phosphodiesterase zeta-1 [Latimeria chalumnae]